MSTILDQAKSAERSRSNETTVSIRLTLLQDMIRELERLEAERPLASARKAAELREASQK